MKKKFVFLTLIFMLLIANFSNVFATDASDITFSDWGVNNGAYVEWIANLSECKSGEYYIFQGWANFDISSGNNYVVFIDKKYFDENNIKAYLKYDSNKNLYYLCFSKPCYTCECYTGSRYCQDHRELRSQSIRGFVGGTSLGGYTTLPVIYRDSSFSSSSVFSGVAPVEETRLGKVLTLEEGQKTIAEIVGLLPLILVVVVSFLGLRKALNLLLTLLRRS